MKKEKNKALCIALGTHVGFAYSKSGFDFINSTTHFRDVSPNEFKTWLKQLMSMVDNLETVFYFSPYADDIGDLEVLLIDACIEMGASYISVDKDAVVKAQLIENCDDDEIKRYYSSFRPRSINEAYAIALLLYVL